MRVMQVMAGAAFGGAEAFFVRLVLALRRAKLHQHVIIRENAERAQRLRDGGVDPVELTFGGRLDWNTPRVLRTEAVRFKPNVVMTWMNRASLMMKPGPYALVARLGGYYDLKYYRHCDHLVGNTEDIVAYVIKEGWPRERAHYLPNFVSAEGARPVDRSQYYTPDDAPLILAMGRLHVNKAFDVLFQSLVKAPGAYLWLAGDGPERPNLEAQAERLGIRPRLRFLGWRDDTAELLRTCDLFVCPSRHEPLGNVVLEAWAQQRPVVAAASQGPGALIEDGVTGILVPVDDPRSLGLAMADLLDDPGRRAAMAAAGHRAYLDRFTEAAVVRQYLDFFDKVSV
ncbi:MAG: glycosyltransferase [Hyphomicrobiales bacterium]|nr:glycosyltransferase [Hyphomicrobiales bacterium]MCP5370993.1 glycosyltransferase [Hyphomicrobiales bacterium]